VRKFAVHAINLDVGFARVLRGAAQKQQVKVGVAEQRARKSCAARIISFPSPLPPPDIISPIIVSGRTILPRFNSLLIVIGSDRVYRRSTRGLSLELRRSLFLSLDRERLQDGLDAWLRISSRLWPSIAGNVSRLSLFIIIGSRGEWTNLMNKNWPDGRAVARYLTPKGRTR